MQPRNLTFYRFTAMLTMNGVLGVDLLEARLKPVGPLELSSRGFVPPMGVSSDVMVAVTMLAPNMYANWITVGGEDRMLPASVINAELADRLRASEAKEGRKPGGRLRKAMRDDIIHELLPKAFVKPSRIDAMLHPNIGVLAIDSASMKQAEGVVSELRRALGSFPAIPLNPEVPPRAVMTGWLTGDPLPVGIELGDECTLTDMAQGGRTVRVTGMDLRSHEVLKHIEAGMQVTRVGLTYLDDCRFVLGDDMVIRKLKLLDGATSRTSDMEVETVEQEVDARAFLSATLQAALFYMLKVAFKLSDD